MSRLLWVGIGAAGGILAYRKVDQVRRELRSQGVARVATGATNSALDWVERRWAANPAAAPGQADTMSPWIPPRSGPVS